MSRPPKSGEEDFLSRWSRRKRTGAVEPDKAEPDTIELGERPDGAIEAPGQARGSAAAADERPDEEILEELGLPDPDSLKPGDDVRGFMAKAVPERLRNRALRKLWLTNPVLANLDELVDYGEDFTDAATVIENLQTVYRVGKGMLPDPVEEEDPAVEDGTLDQEESEVALAEAPDPEEDTALTGEDPPDEPEVEAADAAPPIPAGITQDTAPEPLAAPSRSRKMRFRVESG